MRLTAAAPELTMLIASAGPNRLILRDGARRAGITGEIARVRIQDVYRVNGRNGGSQLWLVDADGTVKKTAQLRPYGESWAELVISAARRLAAEPSREAISRR